MKKSKVLALALSFVMALSMTSVPVDAAKKVNVKKVTVESSLSGDKKTVVIAKGKSVKLKSTVTVKPAKKANKKVSYSVANKKIATVTSKGVVKGKKVGSTTITVTSSKNKGKKAKIKVKVFAKPVQKVTLDKTSGALTIGQTDTLTAKVKAKKGACKKVAFVSSNAAVATVSKKGVVSAVGEGTAVITARAIDGSKKKATYTVTVTNPINLAAMDVLNAQSVTFALDKPLALTADKVNIKRKQYQSGTYNNTLKINSLTTSDNVNYTAVVDNDSRIAVGNYIQVEVPTLTGVVKSLDKQYMDQKCAFTEEVVSKWYVGTYSKEEFSFGADRGYSNYAISGVPAGLTAEVKGDSLYVKGVPTTTGKLDATLTATDEMGNTLTRTIHFIVGDDNTMVGAGVTLHALVGGKPVSLTGSAYFVGCAKDSYKYEIVSDPSGVVDKSKGVNSAWWSDAVTVTINTETAGTYSVTVRATNVNDPAKYADATIVFDVKQGITIGGVIKDGQGNQMSAGKVTFVNKNRGAIYATYREVSVAGDTSTYSAIVEPGIYDIEASYSYGSDDADDYTLSTKYLYAQELNDSKTGYDIQLDDIYKVVLTSNDREKLDLDGYYNLDWQFNHVTVGHTSSTYNNGSYIRYDAIYLKNGTYALETPEMDGYDGTTDTTGNYFDGWTTKTAKQIKYKYTASVTVNGAATQANIQRVVTKETPGTTFTYSGAKNTTKVLTTGSYQNLQSYDALGGTRYAGYFIPSEDGTYQISPSYMTVYDTNGNTVYSDMNGYSLKAGQKYIIDSLSDYSVTITKYTATTPVTPEDDE